MSDTKTGGSRKTLILLVVVFVLPVILAKLALDNDFFNRGATNRGELLQPTLNAQSLFGELPKKWRVVYVVPTTCDQTCQNAIYSIQQVDLALGKESDRANATLVITPESANVEEWIAKDNRTEVLNTKQENVNKVFNSAHRNGIFLVDTMNNAMLRYNPHADQQQAIMQSRDVLSDLKKMLKLSRIG
ncbi:hypothetical protein DRW07_10530 [Alteromonas sediminis]|uniref:Cytochrome oxidase assembly protein n=1 Tax=Alteromonas sediminis TaxID=2259342 RepID=A0A3N5Y1R9_9ALTE|nr:hypothetical protein [Alteromonas sediminis]RPJ66516.1 hypothetical protein DRW07_10530 [Alteromonas sediminis]